MVNYELFDFDTAFSNYLQKWYQKNFGRFRTYDEMEDCVPDVYQLFLDEPADFLDGEKPGEFFNNYNDPGYLINWLAEYVHQDVNVPDMLLNRISDLGESAVPELMQLLSDVNQPEELRMHLISLLREIDSTEPYPMFIDWIERWDGKDEVTENAVESLESAESLNHEITEKIKSCFENATPSGKVSFLSILSRDSRNADMVQHAIRLFDESPELRIYLASILARFGQSSALKSLKKAALSPDTGYLLYIELRSAIEALGGEAPKRKFTEGDPEYDSLRSLED